MLAQVDKYQTSKPVMVSCGFNSHSKQFIFCCTLKLFVNIVQKCQIWDIYLNLEQQGVEIRFQIYHICQIA